MLVARPNSPRPIGPALRTLLILHFLHSQVRVLNYIAVKYFKIAHSGRHGARGPWPAAEDAQGHHLPGHGRGGCLVGAADARGTDFSTVRARRERRRAST